MKQETVLHRQIAAVIRQEERFFSPQSPGAFQRIARKVEEKLPEKAAAALQKAFALGFEKVFQSGTGLIEKTFDPEKSRAEAEYAGWKLRAGRAGAGFRQIERQAGKRVLGNRALSAAEGAALGLLGIGMPDIPVFIGMLLKTVYEVAIAYGFGYEQEGERLYILRILRAALAQDGREQSEAADRIARLLDTGAPLQIGASLSEEIQEASQLLCARLLAAKAVQGLPFLGIAGGGFNWAVLGRVGRAARLKYRKRMLLRMQEEIVQNKQ